MIYQNPQHSAQLLADKIKSEQFEDLLPVSINPDAFHYCQTIADQLSLKLTPLEVIINQNIPITQSHILILDDGSTRVGEYPEFVDYLRQKFPRTNIIIAVPFIPASEEAQFKQLAESLITLQVEPLFFSIDQFYQQN